MCVEMLTIKTVFPASSKYFTKYPSLNVVFFCILRFIVQVQLKEIRLYLVLTFFHFLRRKVLFVSFVMKTDYIFYIFYYSAL